MQITEPPREKKSNAGIGLVPSRLAQARGEANARFCGSVSAYVDALIERDIREYRPLRERALKRLSPEERHAFFLDGSEGVEVCA